MAPKTIFPVEAFQSLPTPFYYYDLNLLRLTLETLRNEAMRQRVTVHYAVKANANPRILSLVKMYGLGVDCVSGGEIRAALQAGFSGSSIVFAGVGKADWEIRLALENDIFCFNVESEPELEVINQLALEAGRKARVALRVNPDVHADTHHYITTGLKENKFGINLCDVDRLVDLAIALPGVELTGLHFHIGSQLLEMDNYVQLCARVNDILAGLEAREVTLAHVNLGGGLGIDYHRPDEAGIPAFADYLSCLRRHIKLRPDQTLHVEPGRSVVAQCGSLIARTLYVKKGINKQFAILDAGFTELIRPALYQAYHQIDNLSSTDEKEVYDVVGPICESTDCFAKDTTLNRTKRGDFVALRSAGAYGEIMASNYNCRPTPKSYFSDDLA